MSDFEEYEEYEVVDCPICGTVIDCTEAVLHIIELEKVNAKLKAEKVELKDLLVDALKAWKTALEYSK